MGRDQNYLLKSGDFSISIHSPRMGRDSCSGAGDARAAHFNPLSPHGERLVPVIFAVSAAGFQSTLPAWGETLWLIEQLPDEWEKISIHSPRMGRDRVRRKRREKR